MRIHLDGGGVIFDAFSGSGTSLVAAKELGRQYIGFEIDDKFYEIAKNRLDGVNIKGEMNLFYQEEHYEQMNLFEEREK